jgi:hypothetical protein
MAKAIEHQHHSCPKPWLVSAGTSHSFLSEYLTGEKYRNTLNYETPSQDYTLLQPTRLKLTNKKMQQKKVCP